MNESDHVNVIPFLKWAGGKRQLMSYIRPLIPPYTTYYEPFLGGGALLFNECPEKALINDLNDELINCYKVIKANPNELIELLVEHSTNNSLEYFYRIRNVDRQSQVYKNYSEIERAARIIYLNKTCFNGLYRVNSSGEFNAPYGRYANPNIVNEDVIKAVSGYLNSADIEIYSGDYRKVLIDIPDNTFIYFDPPYMPITDSSFTSYTSAGFDINEQIALKEQCDILNEIGVKFLLSNSSCDFIEGLYKDYIISKVPAKRNINSNGKGRGTVYEVLIRNYDF